MRTRTTFSILAAAAALALSGCGGGGGGGGSAPASGSTSSLSGTAASGMPIVGTVQVTDSRGTTKRVNIGANGSYSIDITGMTAPFVLAAEGTVGGKTVRYFAPATADDINRNINVTPLSDLLLANVASDLAANCAASPACISALTTAGINAARSDLATRLAPTLAAMGLDASTDLLRASFTGGSHAGIDALLDVLDVTVDTTTKIATVKDLVSGATVSDDLGSSNDNNTQLPAGPSGNDAYSIAVAVKARLAEMDAIILSSDSPAVRKQKLMLFCTDDFLSWGKDCDANMSSLSTEKEAGFTSLTSMLEQIARFDVTGVDGIDPTGVIDDQNVGTQFKGEGRFTFLWRKGGDGKFYWAGDRTIGDVGVTVSHRYEVANQATPFVSMLEFYIEPGTDGNGNLLADSATVTGPGLPQVGIDYAQNPYSNWFARTPSNQNYFNWVAEGEYDPAQVEAAVASRAAYTITLKKGGSIIAAYKYSLLAAPLPQSSLTAAMFPSVTNSNGISLATCQNGGSWTPSISWNGLTGNKDLNVSCGDSTGAKLSEVSVEGTAIANPITLIATPTATWGSIWLRAQDSSGRGFAWNESVH